MLRITTEKNPQTFTLRLEGRLEGPWVTVLDKCWRSAQRRTRGRWLCVDLKGVTFVDARGKRQLAEMDAAGAELLGDDLETKALVADIQLARTGPSDGKPAASNGGTSVVDVREQLVDLQRLQAELHEVNQELVLAARPLERLAEMNEAQRQQLAKQIRERLVRWESVTDQISKVMGTQSANDRGTQTFNEGEVK